MTTPQYRYKPLSSPSQSVRLVVLHPSTIDSEISFDLVTVAVDSAPEYEALSYTWGAAVNFCETAVSDGKYVFAISPSLRTALLHLRHEREERMLWIDAICINQEDNKEKNAQVGVMIEIYKRAKRVVIWIGEESRQSERAIKFLREMGRVLVRNRIREHDSDWRSVNINEGEDSAAEEEILAPCETQPLA